MPQSQFAGDQPHIETLPSVCFAWLAGHEAEGFSCNCPLFQGSPHSASNPFQTQTGAWIANGPEPPHTNPTPPTGT
eukprot:363151-Chlamydomonas_euryale.AAC.4